METTRSARNLPVKSLVDSEVEEPQWEQPSTAFYTHMRSSFQASSSRLSGPYFLCDLSSAVGSHYLSPATSYIASSMGNLSFVWHEYSCFVSITDIYTAASSNTLILVIHEMPYGPVSLAFSTANSFGTLLAERCVILEDFSSYKPALVNSMISFHLMYRPSPDAMVPVFITLIVKVPVIQILTMITGLESPLPQLESLTDRRSIVFRIVMLLPQTILYYQASFFVLLLWNTSNGAAFTS